MAKDKYFIGYPHTCLRVACEVTHDAGGVGEVGARVYSKVPAIWQPLCLHENTLLVGRYFVLVYLHTIQGLLQLYHV
jgi:hypothetical protein